MEPDRSGPNRRSWRLRIPLGIGLLMAAVFVGCRASTPRSQGLVDGRLTPCPSSPNCVSSEEDGEAFVAPFGPFEDPTAAFRELLRWCRAQEDCEVRSATEDYAWIVFYTPLLKFADDLELRVDSEAGVVHVRSASRLGYSDLGVNGERVERLRSTLEVWRQAHL